MQYLVGSFGGKDVLLYFVILYVITFNNNSIQCSFHFNFVFVLFSFLFSRALQARWLAYTCHHRTWQSVGSERYCCGLSLCVVRLSKSLVFYSS